MSYQLIHTKIHELEALLSTMMNATANAKVAEALGRAHDNLVHQVAEYVTTAESKTKRE